MDHDDALAKLEKVPERQSEAPGQLFDAGEGLDPGVSPTAALLLLFKTHKQLGSTRKKMYQHLSACQWQGVAIFFRCAWDDYTCCKQSTRVRALSILSICLVLYIVSLMMSPKSL